MLDAPHGSWQGRRWTKGVISGRHMVRGSAVGEIGVWRVPAAEVAEAGHGASQPDRDRVVTAEWVLDTVFREQGEFTVTVTTPGVWP